MASLSAISFSTTLKLAELVLGLYENLNPRKSVVAEIRSMESWLRSMKAFIEDNDGREGGSRLLEDKVEKVRETAYDIEDVLDEILFHTPPYLFHDHEFTRKAHNFAHNVYHGFPFRGISDKIAIIKKSIDDIQSQHVTFSVNPGPSSSRSRTRVARPPLLDDKAPLLASYMDLSTDLKSCLLYFSIFPEDYSVERGRLIRLWVAEGFVKGRGCMTAEEVAEENLNELIHRNLVHVSNWDFDERPRKCRVVDPVLRVIIQKSRDENFASIFPRENTREQQRIRRLSLTQLPQQNTDFSCVRSMFLLRSSIISPSDLEKNEKNLRNFKLLKVLDLQAAPLEKFSEAITLLVLLRYLCLRATNINMIPSSIKKLSYLETLDLKQTDVIKLPNEISHLHNLRHLFAYKYDVKNFAAFDSVHGVNISEGICKLANLQDLSLVKVDKKGRILEELQQLSQLRKLGLMGIKGKHGKVLCASIQKMQKLTTLSLSSITEEEFLEVGEMKDPPRTLERLYLKGPLQEFPGWISELKNLRRIGLNWSKMEESPLRALKCLPNLMELQLVDSYIGDELKFEASGFEKLKILLIEDFSELNVVVIEKGAIPKLEKISLCRCPKLRLLPLGMENLAKVGKIILHGIPEELIARLRKNFEDRVLVERIRCGRFLF
ncbi:hypothetical protein BUALT_Bualt18G0108200 [Buddleja alternifolia]|uniref:Rx N-terminal domain-containing protein n=1 Tax=Buddleja alternifolia TaxID=168488 RepID=A0AAV6W2V5_9LAMI|nr:hypothetical protein BUALT_Bualt18G0108200 [Buddleja alternifolia]